MTLFMNSPYHWPSLIDQSALTGFRQAGMIIRIPVQTRLKINFPIRDHKKFFENWFTYLIVSGILSISSCFWVVPLLCKPAPSMIDFEPKAGI